MENTPIITAGATGVDYFVPQEQGIQTFGNVAQRLMSSGFKVSSLRTCETLRKDDWITLDNTLLEVARQRLRGVNDLMSRGLRFGLNNPLGTTRLEWEQVSNMSPAEVNMSGLTESELDRVLFSLVGMPIPIIHKDFFINIRALEASRNGGSPLDTTQVALSTRLVTEKIEDLLFNGGFDTGANGAIYGYTNVPTRNTGSVTADWDGTATGEQILDDVLEMIALAQGDNMYGPYVLYVPSAWFVYLQEDFKTNSDKSVYSRLKEIPMIEDIMPTENLTTSVVLVQMTRDVVDMVDGLQPTVIQWDSKGGMQLNFKVMAIMVPRIKADYSGQSGIVHYS